MFLTCIMMIFVVLYVFVVYNLYINSSGTDIKKSNENVSGEGEGTEGARKLSCLKRRETPQLYPDR